MIGETVHYVSHGTPVRPDGTQAFPSVCRAATVTLSDDAAGMNVGLAVLNPDGLFFQKSVLYDDEYRPGTWHRVHP